MGRAQLLGGRIRLDAHQTQVAEDSPRVMLTFIMQAMREYAEAMNLPGSFVRHIRGHVEEGPDGNAKVVIRNTWERAGQDGKAHLGHIYEVGARPHDIYPRRKRALRWFEWALGSEEARGISGAQRTHLISDAEFDVHEYRVFSRHVRHPGTPAYGAMRKGYRAGIRRYKRWVRSGLTLSDFMQRSRPRRRTASAVRRSGLVAKMDPRTSRRAMMEYVRAIGEARSEAAAEGGGIGAIHREMRTELEAWRADFPGASRLERAVRASRAREIGASRAAAWRLARAVREAAAAGRHGVREQVRTRRETAATLLGMAARAGRPGGAQARRDFARMPRPLTAAMAYLRAGSARGNERTAYMEARLLDEARRQAEAERRFGGRGPLRIGRARGWRTPTRPRAGKTDTDRLARMRHANRSMQRGTKMPQPGETWKYPVGGAERVRERPKRREAHISGMSAPRRERIAAARGQDTNRESPLRAFGKRQAESARALRERAAADDEHNPYDSMWREQEAARIRQLEAAEARRADAEWRRHNRLRAEGRSPRDEFEAAQRAYSRRAEAVRSGEWQSEATIGGRAVLHRFGLKPNFTRSDLVAARRRVLKAEHPDRGGTREGFTSAHRQAEWLEGLLDRVNRRRS